MTQAGSYDVSSFATSAEAEIRRLNAQVDLFWNLEEPLFRRYGLADGKDVLDCGCGPGRLIELLKGRMPALRCTGLDIDPLLVDAANRMIAERGLRMCRAHQGTAEQPGLADASFDFVVLRLVLEHVLDPVLSLRSLGRLLRPGGRIIVIDNDFEFHLRTWPAVPQLDRLYEAYCASRRKDGGDPCIGRRLPRYLAEAGFEVVGCEIEAAHNALLGDPPFLRAEGAGIPAQLVHTGFLDSSTLEEMSRAWRAMLAEPGHCIFRPLFVAVGERTMKPVTAAGPSERAAEGTSAPERAAAGGKAPEPSGGTLARIMAFAADVLKENLKEAGKKGLQPGDSMVDLGMDSLAALDLQEKIKGQLGLDVPLDKILVNAPLDSLAEFVDAELAKRGGGRGSVEVSPARKGQTPWEDGEV